MRKQATRFAVLTAALLAAGTLAGCGSLSTGVTKDGLHAQTLVWPAVTATNKLNKGGTYPNIDNLRAVQSGQSKNQIMALIGPPHFGEGFAGVHEWNYLFNLRGTDGKITQCEYKILFDKGMVARSFYWNPAACADLLNPPSKPVVQPQVQTFTLSADALFAFNKSSLADITNTGVADLDALAKKLTAADMRADEIDVIGYTDRIGSDAYNQGLSERRANTVRDYLVSKGVAADHIHAEGRGKADPVKECHDKNRAKLIACLAPNRRVVVKVEGSH